jgi:uncharacterized protein YfkK (UPF0435 family)
MGYTSSKGSKLNPPVMNILGVNLAKYSEVDEIYNYIIKKENLDSKTESYLSVLESEI